MAGYSSPSPPSRRCLLHTLGHPSETYSLPSLGPNNLMPVCLFCGCLPYPPWALKPHIDHPPKHILSSSYLTFTRLSSLISSDNDTPQQSDTLGRRPPHPGWTLISCPGSPWQPPTFSINEYIGMAPTNGFRMELFVKGREGKEKQLCGWNLSLIPVSASSADQFCLLIESCILPVHHDFLLIPVCGLLGSICTH